MKVVIHVIRYLNQCRI